MAELYFVDAAIVYEVIALITLETEPSAGRHHAQLGRTLWYDLSPRHPAFLRKVKSLGTLIYNVSDAA